MIRLSKDKRDKLILVAIGAIAVIAGLWFGIIKTRREQIVQSKSKLLKAMDKLEKAKRVVSHGAQAEQDMEAATRRLATIEDTMASGDLFSWALSLRDKACAGHDVTIIDVARPGKAEVGVLAQFPYEAAIFSLRGSAYYHDLGKFLADFENRFPYFRAQNLSLGTGSGGAVGTDSSASRLGDEKLSFKMDIVALIKPNQ